MAILVAFSVGLATLSLTSSCAHVTPVIETQCEASFDGNVQNSGIVKPIYEYGPDGDRFQAGWEITPDALSRYNSFISKYGDRLNNPIKRNYGTASLENGNYSLTEQAATYWKMMILLSKRDRVNHS